MLERVLLGEAGEGTGGDQQTKGWDLDSHLQALPSAWWWQMGSEGLQKDTSLIFYFLRHLFPCSLPLHWISYILITSTILKSTSPAIIQALLMTPSAKVSIRQVGIRRAETKAGQRVEHGSVLVQATHKAAKAPNSLSQWLSPKATMNTRNSPEGPIHRACLPSYSPCLPRWLALSWASASHTKPLQMFRRRPRDQHSAESAPVTKAQHYG